MIEQIEQAIVDHLNQAAIANGLKVKAESYGGQLTDDLLSDAAQAAPAIWTAFGGMKKHRRIGREVTEYEAAFAIIVAAKSVNQVSARQGGRGGLVLGAYQLIHFVIQTLDSQTLDGFCPDLLSRALEISKVTNLFNAKISDEHLAIYSAAVSCRFIWTREVDPTLEDLEVIFHSSSPDTGGATVTGSMETNIPQKEDS